MKFYSNLLKIKGQLPASQWGLIVLLVLFFVARPLPNVGVNRQGTLPRLAVIGQRQQVNWSVVTDLSARPLNSRSVLLVDLSSGGTIMAAKNARQVLSLASLTKLMSLKVVRDSGLALNAPLRVSQVAQIKDWRSYLGLDDAVSQLPITDKTGDTISVAQAIAASEVASANNVVLALSQAVKPQLGDFVYLMNEAAINWGLTQTIFTDPTGLSPSNHGTALEVARLANWVWQDSFLRLCSSWPQVTVRGRQTDYVLKNTNKLLAQGDRRIMASKTGHLKEVGYSVVMEVKDIKHGQLYLLVLLGATSDEQRWQDVNYLLSWLESRS